MHAIRLRYEEAAVDSTITTIILVRCLPYTKSSAQPLANQCIANKAIQRIHQVALACVF
jgi:hypothetical protein